VADYTRAPYQQVGLRLLGGLPWTDVDQQRLLEIGRSWDGQAMA